MAALVAMHAITKVHRMGETSVHALRGVDLTIARGEMVAIMGPSGSGKSTLMNILGTLDRQTSGSYRLDGHAVDGQSDAALAALRNRTLGFVFQQFNLLPRETALQNVELPLVYAGMSRSVQRERALRALARVGLAERTHHLPTQLSGGQQQRVSIARALVHDPPLLLADEPTGALDSVTSQQVMELLGDLHREGKTIVLVTHDPAIATYAERVVVVRDGAIVSNQSRKDHVSASDRDAPLAPGVAVDGRRSAPLVAERRRLAGARE